MRKKQEQAFLSGIALGFNSITSEDRLQDFIRRKGKSFYDKQIILRVEDILIINDKWKINDSLSGHYLPVEDENGKTLYYDLREIKDLPPLMEGRSRLGDDIENFPNAADRLKTQTEEEAHAISIETSEGRWYVMVILKSDKREIERLTAQPLAYMLAILLFSTIITMAFVWQFTRPIANLSKAAKRIAAGNLNFRLKDAERTDEIGELAARFNEMTEKLEKTRELQFQLQEAEKSAVVGRLASAIAHEIRNPLNYINLSLDHLRRKFEPNEADRREIFEKITSRLKAEVERINRQISDFLIYSRPMRLDLWRINIRSVIEDSLSLIEPQAAEQGVKIRLVEKEGLFEVTGDREVLRSVFNNLFINASQSMEKTGGQLSIVISSDNGFVKVDVKDSGHGISTDHIGKIFQPYFSTKETGTGLGLAIVKKIIEDHKGEIKVESDKNVGTTFTVKLPVK